MRIEFTVPAVPVAQPRPRATSINGKARMYEAKKSHAIHEFKASVRMAAREAYTGPLLDGPLAMIATFYFPRPKRLIWKRREMPAVDHTGKPDWDNLGKALSDALNGIVYVDDSQLAYVEVTKSFAAGGEPARVEVEIWRRQS